MSAVSLVDPLFLGESARQLVVLASSLVLLLMLVAIAGIAYKSLWGDGIRWPGEGDETAQDDGVSRGSEDEEWKYY